MSNEREKLIEERKQAMAERIKQANEAKANRLKEIEDRKKSINK